jgi:hypothetical protein
MIPVDQTVFTDKEKGTTGNCWQAWLASMLEMPLEEIPHFIADGCNDKLEWFSRIQPFLRKLNLAFLEIDLGDMQDIFQVKGLHHELSGLSPRGIQHAVLAVDGVMVHDPHPSRGGVEGTSIWGVLVVLDPSKPSGKFAIQHKD